MQYTVPAPGCGTPDGAEPGVNGPGPVPANPNGPATAAAPAAATVVKASADSMISSAESNRVRVNLGYLFCKAIIISLIPKVIE